MNFSDMILFTVFIKCFCLVFHFLYPPNRGPLSLGFLIQNFGNFSVDSFISNIHLSLRCFYCRKYFYSCLSLLLWKRSKWLSLNFLCSDECWLFRKSRFRILRVLYCDKHIFFYSCLRIFFCQQASSLFSYGLW